jgi:nucleotide-binding universal stress UspA family protein
MKGNLLASVEGERGPNVAENSRHVSTAGSNVKKILAPTDLSAVSEAGVRYALNTARELDAEVLVYHVVTKKEIAAFGRRRKEQPLVAGRFRGIIEAYESRLGSFIKQNFAGLTTSVNVTKRVEFGSPEKNIVRKAKTEGVDLIIMGTSGRSGLSRMFLGSVTEQVIRNAPCPVLAIPSEFAVTDEDLYAAAG